MSIFEKALGLGSGVFALAVAVVFLILPIWVGVGHDMVTISMVLLGIMFGVHNILACYHPLWYGYND